MTGILSIRNKGTIWVSLELWLDIGTAAKTSSLIHALWFPNFNTCNMVPKFSSFAITKLLKTFIFRTSRMKSSERLMSYRERGLANLIYQRNCYATWMITWTLASSWRGEWSLKFHHWGLNITLSLTRKSVINSWNPRTKQEMIDTRITRSIICGPA